LPKDLNWMAFIDNAPEWVVRCAVQR